MTWCHVPSLGKVLKGCQTGAVVPERGRLRDGWPFLLCGAEALEVMLLDSCFFFFF